MRKLRVGVWLKEGYQPTEGGGYGYYSAMVEAIGAFPFSQAEVVFLSDQPSKVTRIGDKPVIAFSYKPARRSLWQRIWRVLAAKLPMLYRLKKYYQRSDQRAEKSLTDALYACCDLVYYLIPGCRYPQFPCIYTLWDLGHMSTFAFPELAHAGRFESRKAHHDLLPHKALLVFCESEAGKQDAVYYLRINPSRLRVLPMIPAGIIEAGVLPVRPASVAADTLYIHYPAQYWAHKNHVSLLYAFRELAVDYPALRLVLCGSDKGNYAYIKSQIQEAGLEELVIDAGFVSTEELKWLYLHSKGLVMPTLLGPSNMPPLEALALGCPVAVSDIPGHRELLGEAALYFNPLDYQDIARAIQELLEKPRIAPLPVRTATDNMPLLDRYFSEAAVLRRLWGSHS